MNIENLWGEYSSNLRAFLQSKISDRDDVDDLLQEVLIKTHNQIGTLRSKDKVKPWLFKIATNTIIDFYRKRGRGVSVELDTLWQRENEVDIQLELSACILPFINELPPETAEVLRVVDLQGISQKRYAAELGIGYSTLKSRVQRGRSQLRTLFDSCCHLELDRRGSVVSYESKSGSCKGC